MSERMSNEIGFLIAVVSFSGMITGSGFRVNRPNTVSSRAKASRAVIESMVSIRVVS